MYGMTPGAGLDSAYMKRTRTHQKSCTVELGKSVTKGPEYFSVVITEEYNVTINSEEFIGTTEYLTL
jgi:hypothetical protein